MLDGLKPEEEGTKQFYACLIFAGWLFFLIAVTVCVCYTMGAVK